MAATEQLHPDDRPPDPGARRGIPRGLLWALALAVVVLTIASWMALSNDRAPTTNGDGVTKLDPTNTIGGLNPAANLVGTDAPAVSFTSFEHGRIGLADLHGKPAVINFWASYCTPCITEMPDLERLHQRYGDDVVFVGIATTDRSEDAARAMAAKTGVSYTLGLDPPGDIARSFGAIGLPSTYVIDAQGVVRYQHTEGAVPMDELTAALDGLTR